MVKRTNCKNGKCEKSKEKILIDGKNNELSGKTQLIDGNEKTQWIDGKNVNSVYIVMNMLVAHPPS